MKFSSPFLKLSEDTSSLLPKGKIKYAIFSATLAFLEVFSLTAILPIFYRILHGGSYNATVSAIGNLHFFVENFDASAILITIVLIFIFKNLLAGWLMNLQSLYINKLYLMFSERFYRDFFRHGWTQHAEENSAETFRKIKHVPYEFTHYVVQSYFQLITDVLICLMMIAIVSLINYQALFVIAGLSTPVIVFHYLVRRKIIEKIDKSFRELTPKANILLGQGIDSYLEAKIYKKEDFFIRHFIRVLKKTSAHLASLRSFGNLPSMMLETLGIICLATIIIYNKSLPETSQNTVLLIALLSLALYRVVPSINRILTGLSQIQAYAYSVSAVKEKIDAPLKGTKKTRPMTFENQVELRNISFQYSGAAEAVLINLNFIIRKGDFIVLRGPSGSGKTTLIHILAGLITGYEGGISIDNTILTHENLPTWQENLGIVPQQTIILQDTILNNIAFGEEQDSIDIARAEKAASMAEIYEFIQALPLKLDTPVGENGITLSGGQRQRIVLARAFYQNPKVLLLDEVSNHLDEHTKTRVLKTLKIMTEGGTTVVLASHNPIARNLATRILHVVNKFVSEEQS